MRPLGVTDPLPGDAAPRPLRIVRALGPLYPGVSATRLKRAVLEGQVTVNGIFLPRISAGKLAELCSSADNKSTIVWTPK